nr:hypothetical protein [Tanacetum cinerariifolium]
MKVRSHQGSKINPYAFDLILDELSRWIQEDIPWYYIFTDDIMLVSESEKGLNNILENLREALEDNNLRVSREKTKYLRRIDEDVSHRIKAAWIKPDMLYGSEYCPITKALANRVEVAEVIMLMWTCGKTMFDMIPNGVYRAELEVETIINKMRVRRFRWYGHVRRRPQSLPVRRVEALVVVSITRKGIPKLSRRSTWKQSPYPRGSLKDVVSDWFELTDGEIGVTIKISFEGAAKGVKIWRKLRSPYPRGSLKDVVSDWFELTDGEIGVTIKISFEGTTKGVKIWRKLRVETDNNEVLHPRYAAERKVLRLGLNFQSTDNLRNYSRNLITPRIIHEHEG